MLRRAWTATRVPIAAWFSLTVVVLAIQHVSKHVLRDDHYQFGHWYGLSYYFDGLLQYDGHRYLSIATDGYSYHPGVQSKIAWYPVYPLLMRYLAPVAGNEFLAGVFVTIVATGVFFVLYWLWLGLKELDGLGRLIAFALLAIYPYSWYLYGVVYADAVFLAAALAAVLLVERDHMVLGGLAGALALGTRPTALAVVPALLAIAATRHGVIQTRPDEGSAALTGSVPSSRGRIRRAGHWLAEWTKLPTSVDWTRIRPATLAPLLSLGGLLAYMAYLWRAFGDPFISFTNEKTFHGRFPIFKLTFAARIVHFGDDPTFSSTITFQAILLGAVLLSTGAVARRFGFPYAVLVLGAVAIPVVGTHDFMGTGRYLLVAFPAFAVAGEWLARRPALAWTVVVASGLLMMTMAFWFSRSWYLS